MESSSLGSPASFAGGFNNNPKLPSVPYKRYPLYPMAESSIDPFHSNVAQPPPTCATCFPQAPSTTRRDYVDLLEFSAFNGLPWSVAPGAARPTRWLADLRYTLSTPLLHHYPTVHKEVMACERVARVVAMESNALGASVNTLRKRAARFFTEIRATLSRAVCKVCAWLLFKLFRRLMTRLLVNPAQMDALRRAEGTGVPLVYLPLHRSHLDYLMITWCAWHFGLRLPHIASGDNLNLSGFGWLLRATGAFFIRRRLDEKDEGGKDVLYRAVLHSYIEQLLKKGQNIEFFLEGTRSRFGKSLLPKHGLISNVVDAVQLGIIPDVYLVPVSYTYDQVAEGIFLDELMGVPKVRESVVGVVKGVLAGILRSKRCGQVRMHFAQPVLLSEYLASLTAALSRPRKAPPPSSLSRLPHSYSYRELVPWHCADVQHSNNRTLIRSIGYHIIYEAQSQCSISFVSVVSSLLLCKFRAGVSLEVLAADTQWLCERIIAAGGEVCGWRKGETCGQTAVEYALSQLHDTSLRIGEQVDAVTTHRQAVHLAYYKNAIVPMFGVRAAIALAIVCRQRAPLPLSEVLDEVMHICSWMQFELIFVRPCADLRECVVAALDSEHMSSPLSGLLLIQRDETSGWGDGDAEREGTLEVRSEQARDVLVFYSNLLRPFLQTLFLVVDRLIRDPQPSKETEFVRDLIRQSLSRQAVSPMPVLLEAINSDSVRNCIRVLRDKGVLAQQTGIQVLVPQRLHDVRENVIRVLGIF